MHDLNSKNITEDPVQIPDQVDDVVPLTPVQIFIKEEEPVSCKAEEPVLVSLVPVLPKDEDVIDSLRDDFEDGSGSLVINLENSSSEECSNHSDPLTIEYSAANISYVEYVDSSDHLLMDLGETATGGPSDPLCFTQETTSIVEDGELYHLTGNAELVQVSENHSVSPGSDTGSEYIEIPAISQVPVKTFQCGYCSKWFFTEGEMQMHTLCHTEKLVIRREVVDVKPPKPVHKMRAQHMCGDCGESFDRLEHLMRHRLGHLRATLRKPFSVPQTQTLETSDSCRTVAAVTARTSPKRRVQQSVTSSQRKRWMRRKKLRRRWLS